MAHTLHRSNSVPTMLLGMALAFGLCWLDVPAHAQQTREPDFEILVEGTFDPETLAEFKRRTEEYAALRSKLEAGLPPLRVTENGDEIVAFERRLARRLRGSRSDRRGQIFIPAMAEQIKQMLALRADAPIAAIVLDDGPPEFDIDINDRYSKDHPLATMPPGILLRLPDLPRDLEYRFVGRHLILYDVRANMIVDEIRYALRCDGDCALRNLTHGSSLDDH